MLNFALSHCLGAIRVLDSQISHFNTKRHAGIPEALLSDEEKERFKREIQIVAFTCKNMSLETAEKRILRIGAWLASSVSYSALFNELVILKQAIDDDVMFERFYHYPKTLSELPMSIELDWRQTLIAFPGLKSEIFSGVDCYALKHPTASIFHLMRVAEHGLRALAAERKIRTIGKKKPIEWAAWQEILTHLERARQEIGSTWKAGAKKDAALGFYSGALHCLHSFKDKYRNLVTHVRKTYEMEDAAKVMRQVRDFMNDISMRVGETTRGSIKKWT